MEEVTSILLDFLREIGLQVRLGDLPDDTFLPGVQVDHGSLVVDLARLRYPGDLLHEAGHLALREPARRAETGAQMGGDAIGGGQTVNDAGEEMGAIAWSWAAVIYLKLDPEVVFHPAGYRGGARAIIENFSSGRYIAVPLLQWMGLTADPVRAAELGVDPYPHMLAWLRS